MDGSLPGSSLHRILQARILEWVAVPNSREYHISGGQEVSFIPYFFFFFTVVILLLVSGPYWSIFFLSFLFKKHLFIYLAGPFLSCGMWDLVPSPGSPHWKCRVLATGPPGKSLYFSFLNIFWKAGNGDWSSVREDTGISFLGITLCLLTFGNLLDHEFHILISRNTLEGLRA